MMTPCFGHAVFRFAPSPNGYLHLGHAYSAMLNRDMARAAGGRFLLRIEDIDLERSRPEYEAAIYEDLSWLGILWEEPVRRQSEHFSHYRAAVDALDKQRLVYPCFCTRGDIGRTIDGHTDWRRDPDGSPLYPGTCRHLSPQERRRRLDAGADHALRIDMERAMAIAPPALAWREYERNCRSRDVCAEPHAWGDAIVARKDVPASYHLSVVADDALQGVTNVVRGHDLLHATSLHRLLQHLLRLPTPQYHHHRLIVDEGGRKLSKSNHATALRVLRADGISVTEIRRLLQLQC